MSRMVSRIYLPLLAFIDIILLGCCGGLKCPRKIPPRPALCDLENIACREYNGKWLAVDVNSVVDHYDDVEHCESLGMRMYVPETEADNWAMQEILNELHSTNGIVWFSYPIVPSGEILIWEDGQQTRFDSGVYWQNSAIIDGATECYYMTYETQLALYMEFSCSSVVNHHLCYFP